jgi:hypothetical protein
MVGVSSETEQDNHNAVGFGAALDLVESETPSMDPRSSSQTRLAAIVGAKRGPSSDSTVPPTQRILAGVSMWAFALALGGVIVGMAALVRIVAGEPSWWFKPLIIILVGFVGMGLTVGGFVTVQRRLMPWMMLTGATLALFLGAIITTTA